MTTNPSDALRVVVGLAAWPDFGGPMVWHDIDDEGWTQQQREVMAASVNFIREHGAALAQALEDSARLDWAETHMHALCWDEHGYRICIEAATGVESSGDTWRDSLDIAIAAQQKEADGG